ncbi:ATP-binding domain-containing protein [Streptomyces sp. MSC1_001]|uniref:ATP-binding domain-containing protein n=1 Tax=Streptomyces sp. MSC1_001 TaxID=2909263 RepID=UPI00202E621C|nr:ATP-binding domain-containing protein [Streptomyces sp. MSC1_001]
MTLTYLDLTPAQRELLDALPFDGNHLVDGPPGSGKSVLAAQRVVMLALTGTPAVLLTRSNLLRQSVARLVSELCSDGVDITVATAHSWLAGWYGGDAPRADDGWYDWPAFYERAALADPVDLARPLTLVVDEGQDLPPAFYRLCRILGARTTVFADECQRLTTSHSTLAEIAGGLGRCPVNVLHGNHRNTRQTAELAARFHTGPRPPELPGREGPLPRLHALSNLGAVSDLLLDLVASRPDRSIGVVVHSTQAQFELLTRLEQKAPRLRAQMYASQATEGRYRTLDLSRPGIVIVHRSSAKGLQFDTVVVPDSEADAAVDPTSASLRMAYYVMATRARHELHFAYAGDSEPELLKGIPPRILARG